jgi:hypothetical protein
MRAVFRWLGNAVLIRPSTERSSPNLERRAPIVQTERFETVVPTAACHRFALTGASM